jgi:hypothetical protein
MARASTLGFAMAVNVLIPFLSDYLRVVFDQFADLFELSTAKSIRFGQQERLDPKLSVFLRAFNVNVDGLFSLPAKEEKPVSMMAKDFRHRLMLAKSSFKNLRQPDFRSQDQIEPCPQRNQRAHATIYLDAATI